MTVYEDLRTQLMKALTKEDCPPEEKELMQQINSLIVTDSRTVRLPVSEKRALADALFASVRKLDVLQSYLDDPEVTEIMVNGYKDIFIERQGVLIKTASAFSSPEKLADVIQLIAGRCNHVINASSPIVDARLEDGSRVCCVIAPAALDGDLLTIRKFPKEPIRMRTLLRYGSISEEAAVFLRTLVGAGYSILISGGTSAGKTTFLNALTEFIPPSERVVTIEDNAELQVQGLTNLVRLEAKKANREGGIAWSIGDLIRTSLRMRPDRIIVGEVRGGEALDMLQALNTGHDGSMSTLHANSAADAIQRLSTMVLMALPLPLPAIYAQIASGVDLIVHLGRRKEYGRLVLEIAEVGVASGRGVALLPLYRWSDASHRLEQCGVLSNTAKLEAKGIFYES